MNLQLTNKSSNIRGQIFFIFTYFLRVCYNNFQNKYVDFIHILYLFLAQHKHNKSKQSFRPYIGNIQPLRKVSEGLSVFKITF